VTPRARVIGLGQALAGDDGVGLAVLERLGAAGVPDGVELVSARDESALLALLETPAPVVLLDAVLGGRPGEVVELGRSAAERPGVDASAWRGRSRACSGCTPPSAGRRDGRERQRQPLFPAGRGAVRGARVARGAPRA
jgi:hypothetical protein